MAATPIEKMDIELEKILDEYAEHVGSALQDAVKKAAQKGRSALKSASPRSKMNPAGRKHYADNWAVKDESGRLSINDIIYNKSPTYRVAHLLEHGHAKRGGGRVPPIVHIKPVEEDLEKFV